MIGGAATVERLLPPYSGVPTKSKGRWRSWLARLLDMQKVTGSSPVRPTHFSFRRNKHFCYLPVVGSAAWIRGAKR